MHYVVTLDNRRSDLLEYKAYKTQKFEIQIRSILQHAWAEIEHDIGYKSKGNIPDNIKRNFSRVAALLETSDLEFTKLRVRLTEYEQEVGQEIIENPNNVDLNDISLSSLIISSKVIKEIDELISQKTQTIIKANLKLLDTSSIPRLEYLNIINIEQLVSLLEQRKDEIVQFATLFNEGEDPDNGFFNR